MDFLRNSYVGITRAASVPFFTFFKKIRAKLNNGPIFALEEEEETHFVGFFCQLKRGGGTKNIWKSSRTGRRWQQLLFRIHSDKGMQKAVSFSFV